MHKVASNNTIVKETALSNNETNSFNAKHGITPSTNMAPITHTKFCNYSSVDKEVKLRLLQNVFHLS